MVVLPLVKADLDRATAALRSAGQSSINLRDSLKEIATTWKGIVEIDATVNESAELSLVSNHEAAMCANEIAKEAVQNAVRHGGARNVTIVVDSTPDKLLTMDVKNDGRPIGNVQKGVGSKLLDELTLRWSLENLPTGWVQLHVELPTR